MRRFLVLLVALLALTLAASAAAWDCEPNEPPPSSPPPSSPPPSETRIGVCLPDGTYVNVGASELEAYKSRGAVPAVNGECAVLPESSASSGEPVPGAAGPASPVEVTPPPAAPPVDYCKGKPAGRQTRKDALKLRRHGWTVDLAKHTCREPKTPPNEDLTG
jgi:hypothetical protein